MSPTHIAYIVAVVVVLLVVLAWVHSKGSQSAKSSMSVYLEPPPTNFGSWVPPTAAYDAADYSPRTLEVYNAALRYFTNTPRASLSIGALNAMLSKPVDDKAFAMLKYYGVLRTLTPAVVAYTIGEYKDADTAENASARSVEGLQGIQKYADILAHGQH